MRRGVVTVLALVVGLAWGIGAPSIGTIQAQQQAPVEIFLTQFNYEEQAPAGVYYVLLSITDPNRVGQIDPRLLDLQTGEDIRFGDLIPVTEAELEFRLPTDQLQPGRKYKLAIRAFERGTTTYIRRPTQNPAENPLVFASQEFAFNPPQSAPIVFSIDGVNADFANHVLQIALHHSDTSRSLRYEAVVSDKGGGAVGRVERSSLNLKNGILEAPLPSAMEQVGQASQYQLTFRLFTTDNNKLAGEQRKDFTLPAPPQPNIFQRIGLAFGTNPWLGWSVGGIAGFTILAYLVNRLVPRKRKPLPRPQNLEPVYLQATAPALSPALAHPRPPFPSATAPGGLAPPPQVPAGDRTLVLIINGEQHRLVAGVKLEPSALGPSAAGQGPSPFADVTPNPADATILGLRNLSASPWKVTRSTGQTLVIEKGRSVRLDDGLRIDFGGVEGRVQA